MRIFSALFVTTLIAVSACGEAPPPPAQPKVPGQILPTDASNRYTEKVQRCMLHAYGDADCVASGWVVQDVYVPMHNFNPGDALLKSIYNFYIGRVVDSAASSCVVVPNGDIYSDKNIQAAYPPVVIAEQIGHLSSAEFASEEALKRATEKLRASLGAALTQDVQASFEFNFRREVAKRSDLQVNNLAKLSFFEFRLDGEFKERAGVSFADAYTMFRTCSGYRIITGVVGFFLEQMSGGSKSFAEDVLAQALEASLGATFVAHEVKADLESSLENEVRHSVSSKSELNITMNSQFVPVWYHIEPVPGADGNDGRRCKSKTIFGVVKGADDACVKSVDAGVVKGADDACIKSVDAARHPPRPASRRGPQDSTIFWKVGDVECKCEGDR
jgi:hypothetical protein